MNTIARLFGQSPFPALQAHMQKVTDCVYGLRPLFNAVRCQDTSAIQTAAQQIIQAEKEADQVKNDTRNCLQSGLLMPITRASLLELLSIQDALADHAKGVALNYTLCLLPMPSQIEGCFSHFFDCVMICFDGIKAINQELDRLLETSFGGYEANKVAEMVVQVEHAKEIACGAQQDLLRTLLAQPEAEQAIYLFFTMRVLDALGRISQDAARLAHRIRMLLEVT